MLQELEEGVQALGESRMRYYKILSLFSFENGNEIHYGDGLAARCYDSRPYEEIKEFIKEQKKWVRSNPATPEVLRSRIWWLQIKLVEYAIFTPAEHRSMFPLMVL